MPITLTPLEAVLNVALSFQWVKETGSNRGEAVDQFVRSCGLDPAGAYPWCACFASYVGRAVLGGRWPLPMDAACQTLYTHAQAKQLIVAAPQRGDLFLLWSDAKQRFHHTGFVLDQQADGSWLMVSGNTNLTGAVDGTGVFVHPFRFGPKDVFVRWAS